MSRYEDQSVYRENYLMYELMEHAFTESFPISCLRYKKYDLDSSVTEKDDIRLSNPVLLAKTLYQYICFMELKCQFSNIDTYELLFEACKTIAEGFYFSLNHFYYVFTEWCKPEIFEAYGQTLFNLIEDSVYEKAQYNAAEAYLVEMQSLYVYYKIVKDLRDAVPYKAAIQEMNVEYNDIIIQEILKAFENFEDFREFHDSLSEHYEASKLYGIETTLRSVLFNLLNNHFATRFIHVLVQIKCWFRCQNLKPYQSSSK